MTEEKKAAPVPAWARQYSLQLSEAEWFTLSNLVAKNLADLSGELRNFRAKLDTLENAGQPPSKPQLAKLNSLQLIESVTRAVDAKIQDAS